MTRLPLVLVLGAGLVCSSSVVLARQQTQPGLPTLAQVHILNRERADAVPVKILNTGDLVPVTVVGEPTVALSRTTVMSTRATRQIWEYRRLAVAASLDPTAALNAAGAEGWEAVAATSTSIEIVWTLKRPR